VAKDGVAAGKTQNCLIRSSGQGQDRTVDLPLFRWIFTVADCR
jgi:hypothetical protein